MAFEYDQIESEVVAYLVPRMTNADILVLPENERSYKRTFEKPRVTVAYGGSDFMPTRSTGEVSQEEMVNVLVNIRGIKLRGNLGVYAMLGFTKRLLLGKKFTNVDRLILKSIEFEQREQDVNFWSYTVTFTAKKLQVQDLPDDSGVTYPLLEQVTFNDKSIEMGY